MSTAANAHAPPNTTALVADRRIGRGAGACAYYRLPFLRPQPAVHTGSLYALAALFTGTGLAHFVWPSVFVRIVPPYFSRPRLLVFLSGAAEVAGGIGVLLPALRPYAGWGLILLLCAVFPVHVYMARHPAAFPKIPRWALYARLPLQFVLMAWVYWTACRAAGGP